MRKLIILGIVLFLAAATGACERSAPPEPKTQAVDEEADCSLTMGWDPWEPYHYNAPNGEISGFDIQLARAIAEAAGCEISFPRHRWAALLDKVASGEIDFISGATRTPEREAFALFSDSYRSEDFVLYVRAGEAQALTGDSLRALVESGMRIGVTDAYIYGDAVTSLQDDPEFADRFLLASVGDENATRLLDREIDGFIEDIFVGTATIRRRGLEDEIQVHPLTLQSGGEVCFMFSRASVTPEIVARFDAALEGVRASGVYEEIQGQYLR